MISALLIDLDDTLYDERTYVLSGFRAVAEELAQRHPRLDAAALAAEHRLPEDYIAALLAEAPDATDTEESPA